MFSRGWPWIAMAWPNYVGLHSTCMHVLCTRAHPVAQPLLACLYQCMSATSSPSSRRIRLRNTSTTIAPSLFHSQHHHHHHHHYYGLHRATDCVGDVHGSDWADCSWGPNLCCSRHCCSRDDSQCPREPALLHLPRLLCGQLDLT
jgi:hypothetical protein